MIINKLAWDGDYLAENIGAQVPDSVICFVLVSYDHAIKAIQKMDTGKLSERDKRGNFDLDRYAWLLKAFEYQTHHRGQTTIYLRLAEIKHPNEKLF